MPVNSHLRVCLEQKIETGEGDRRVYNAIICAAQVPQRLLRRTGDPAPGETGDKLRGCGGYVKRWDFFQQGLGVSLWR